MPPPRGGNGGEAAQVSPAEMMQAEVAKLRAQVEQAEARITEAQASAEGFDPEAYRVEREQALAQAVKDAQAALKAWRDGKEGVRLPRLITLSSVADVDLQCASRSGGRSAQPI